MQEWHYFSRTYLAEVTAVNPAAGTIDVIVLDMRKSERNLQLPWGGFSVTGAKTPAGELRSAFKSAWQRFIPHENSVVEVAYTAQNECLVLGYATQKDSYAMLVDQATKNPTKFPRELLGLQRGEWDLRSAGGAYVKGADDGTLLLSAGTVLTRLNKKEDESRNAAGLWEQAAGGSFLRVGAVKRILLPTDFKETNVGTASALAIEALQSPTKAAFISPLAPFTALGNSQNEFWLHLQNDINCANTSPLPIPNIPAVPVVDLQVGRVGEEAVPEFSTLSTGAPTTVPIRWRRRIYAPGSTTVLPINAYEEIVDTRGNQRVLHGTLSEKSQVLGGPLTAFSRSGLSSDDTYSQTASIAVTAPVITPGGGLHLGSASGSQQVIRGNAFFDAQRQVNISLTATLTAVSAALTALAGIPTNAAASGAIGTAVGAITSTLVQIQTLQTAMTGPTSPLLSAKVAVD